MMNRKKNIVMILVLLFSSVIHAQNIYTGTIKTLDGKVAISDVEVFDKENGRLTQSNTEGVFQFNSSKEKITLIFFTQNYNVYEGNFLFSEDTIRVDLSPLSKELMEVEINSRKQKIFELKRLNNIVGTSIYAGKKNEVVLVNQSMANLASNNARQIYSQVAGLNIYQNDDAGLQLNIGGRGLDPNRTANFNTRQNGYDISADVLGYPESYYTPAAEGLEEVQIIRGAASLQYGTQFGGLVNFVMRKPNKQKKASIVNRNTIGSNQLYTNYSVIDGTIGKFSYLSFINYKRGDGFRPNSIFESTNTYSYLGYEVNKKLSISAEITYLDYLAQQAGGLTDIMFEADHLQSNRERNWFQVNWLLYNLNLSYLLKNNNALTLNVFRLDANRYALGFRTNRVSQIDAGSERDLIKGDFNNYGFETKVLSKYKIKNIQSNIILGLKFYKSSNSSKQGPGSSDVDANFDFDFDNYPNYNNQSQYLYPNLNISFFGENLITVNKKLSITPGFRVEHIKTESKGYYKKINLDGAGNVILNNTIENDNERERAFILLGIGLSYKSIVEFYANISQNYRSVTFADISIINPAYTINTEISDENGQTIDFGLRGDYKDFVSFDISSFGLFYNDRIGFIQKSYSDGSVKSERGNIGDAFIYGLEALVDFNINKLTSNNSSNIFNYYINASIINSEYVNSDKNGVEGNKVEFIPNVNIKTGLRIGYRNLTTNFQYSYLSKQFTDASNAVESNLSGVIGEIPSYNVLDFSAAYKFKKFKLELGINNMLNNKYFTRRATGYPGPGIIPAPPLNIYSTLEIRI